MGAVHKFNLDSLIKNYNLVNYVETGTGEGMCLTHALNYPFSRFLSCEITKELFEAAKPKFPKVELHHSNSEQFLSNILPTLQGNSLFFLDAHFPGADFHYAAYDACKDVNLRLPLEVELDLLVKHRKNYNDVIIIDDLRIYMKGPYAGGDWSLRSTAGSNRVGFIFDSLNLLNKSIHVDYRDQGYVVGL